MKRLTYISQATPELSLSVVQQIGEVSMRNNQQRGITGVLLFLDGVFFQILEGEPQQIEPLYQKILMDQRHTNVICLKTESQVTERLFPDWAMKIVDLSQCDEVLIRPVKSLLHTLSESYQIIEKYTQPAISKIIAQGINPLTVPPRMLEKVIMFSDIVAFSTFTEVLPVNEVVELVNDYCTICTKIISAQGGEVVKFIGDCVMASFDATQTDAALHAAIEILQQFKMIRQRAPLNSPLSLLHAGIGMTQGEVIEGNMGSALKMDYTLLGDVVNIASRLEGLTRQLPYSLAICANIKQHCQQPWQFIALGSHQVKGKQNLIDVYSVDNPATYQNIQREPLAALIHQRLKIS